MSLGLQIKSKWTNQKEQDARSFSCVDCSEGWKGVNCDKIQCMHGVPDATEQHCLCKMPYSGQFCQSLEASDVYYYYNQKVFFHIPIAIFLIYCIAKCSSTSIRGISLGHSVT